MRIQHYIYVLALFGFAVLGKAQIIPFKPAPHFIHLQGSDDLSGLEVYDIEQDDQGNMWFATDNGLVRFDGYSFRTFGTKDGLPESVILSIEKTQSGQLFLGFLSKGVGFWHYDMFIPFKYNQTLLDNKPYFGRDAFFLSDQESHVYATLFQKGILSIDKNTGETKLIHLPTRYAIVLCETIDQLLPVFFGPNFADSFPKVEKKEYAIFTRNQVFEPIGFISHKTEYHIAAASMPDGKKIIATNKRLIVTSDTSLVSEILYEGNNLTRILCQPDGSIWLCLRGGRGIHVFQNLKALQANQYTEFLKGASVTHVFSDKRNNLWVSTLNNGLFLSVHPEVNMVQLPGMQGQLVSMDTDNENNVFVGSDILELFQINIKEKTIKTLVPQIAGNSLGQLNWLPMQQRLLASNQMIDVHKNRIDKVLLSSVRFQWPRNQCLPHDSTRIWQISGNYAKCYDIQSGNRLHLIPSTTPRNIDILELSDKTFWLATVDGLFRGNFGDTSLYSYQDKHPALAQRIECLAVTSKGQIVVGTKGHGIILIQNNQYIQIGAAQGLPNENIDVLFIDENDNIWVGTHTGLACIINEVGYKVESYYTSSGLPSNQIVDILQIDKKLWVATTGGLVIFSPFWSEESVSKPQLLSFKTEEVQILDFSQEVLIANSVDNIEISFISINPHLLGNIRYRYRLKSTEPWVETQYTQLNLKKLRYGNYQFEVQAQGTNGTWTDSLMLPFSKEKPFYLKIWFFVLCLSILGLMVYGYTRYYVNRARRKAMFERQIFELERSALQAQMNPHFIFNCLNSIQLLIAKSDPKKAMYFLSTFAALVRRILDNSVKSEVYLSEEIEVVKEYIELEKLRKKDQLEYKIIVAEGVLPDDITLPPMLIQPIVENAIKHGLEPLIDTPGLLSILIESDHKFLFITITDNGVGMPKLPTPTKNPHGYQLVAKRIGLWNRMPRSQCIDIRSRPDFEGTSIRLIIAIKTLQRV